MRLVKYWLDVSVLFLLGCLISLSVQAAPPTFSLAISPATIAPGQIATFTYTIDNTLSGNGTASALTFSNTLPANVVFANPSNASTTCIGGSLSATAGGSTLTFTDYRLGSGQSCTVSATVTSSTAGTHVNTTGVLSSSVGSSGTATANLTVDASLPSLTIAFSPATISPGNISTLIYTIDNTSTGADASLLTLADTLPTGVTLAFIPNPQTTCASGNFVAASNSTTFSFSSASVVNGASCQISVDVTASSLGTYHHTTGIMSSNSSNPSGSAQAILTVENVFLSAAFPNFTVPGTSTTLTYTMINRDRGNGATSIGFSNDLNATLSGLTATALPASGFCGAGSTISGTSTITISGANLVAEASCTFSVTVLIPANAAAGSYTNNTSIVTLNLGGSATTKPAANNNLLIKKAPIITMAFIDDPVIAGQDVTARFTLTNTDSANAVTSINYSWEVNKVVSGIDTKTVPNANSCGTGSTFTSVLNTNSGAITFTMANGALAAGANCTFDVIYTISASQPPGSYLLTTGVPTSINSGVTLTSLAASDTLVVVAAPTLSLAIVEPSIEPDGSVTAQFTLNYNANASSDVTSVGFTVDLGSALTGLTSTTATQNNVCGTGSSFSGTGTLTLTGGSLVAGGSCTFSVNLKVPNDATPATITVASSTISGTTSGQSVSAAAASDTLIISGLTLTKQFVSSPYLPGQNAILRYTITNHANALAATAIEFTDNLSQALSTTQAVSLPTTPCGGSSTMTGTTNLTFAGGELTAGTSCTFDVTILIPAGAAAGSYTSTTTEMTATVNTLTTTISAASAIITVESLTVNLSTTVGTSTETSPIPVVIDFSRAVTNFISTDLVIGNGSVTSLTGSGSSYSATITPTAAGAVTVDLPANVVDDAVDNNHKNPAATQLSITYVSTPVTPTPTVSISAPSVTQATSGPISYTVTYTNAAEINLTANLVTVNKTGTVGNPTINVTNGNTATATVTLTNITGDGTVGISLAANTARNGAKSAAATGPSSTVLIDNTKPTVAITDTVAAVINSSSFTATFTFDEAVTGFAQGDISATNATLSNFTAVSSTVYTVTVTPAAQGTVTLNVAANVAVDGLSNGNNAATQHSVSYDTVSPTVAISGPSSTQNGAFTATFTFNEDVSGFIKDDIVASNAIVSAFVSVSATTYTATVTPGADGSVTLDVAANTAIDTATNGNTAASQYSVTYDMTKPTVAVTANNNPFNGAITATFTFSEDISGFVLGDISVANGVASNLNTVTANRVFTATITPTAQGTFTIDVPAAAVTDGAGNTNNAATQLSLTYDNTPPTVTTAIASGPVNAAFTATFTFSEAVTGFSAADISVTNGSAGTVNATSATVYTATITPTADGLVTVNVPAGGASDSATNTNTAATAVSLTYDISSPTVQISTANSSVNSAFTATITFSEAVTGLVQGDITATNATLSGFAATNSQVYTVTVTPQAEGTVTLNVAAAVVTDGAGNSNTLASPLTINYDVTQPTVQISGPAGPISSGFSATATFSEAVTGFAQSDITVTNGTLSNFVAVSSTVYTVTVTPTADGPITLNIAQNVAQDSASNGNSAASQFSVTSDLTPPTLVISGPSGVLNTAFTATFTFSEGVSGFSSGDVSVTNGSIGTLTTVSTSVYTATVTPTAEGLVNVNVAANSATDSAGNGNTVASQYQISFDNSIPSVVISGPVIANSAFTATITFSEKVLNFVQSDLLVSNGTLSNFSASNAGLYTVTVTPTVDGIVSLDLAANSANDSANNGNSAASQYSVGYDSTPPTVTIVGASGPLNSGLTVTFNFSEKVTGFSQADIIVTNAGLSNFVAVDAAIYTVNISPTSDGVVTLNVPANIALDGANNSNSASTQYSVTYDTTAPTVSITGPTAQTASAFVATITFSEDVTGFTIADISATNGTLASFTATSAKVYTVAVTPIADGTVSLNIAANGATDSATNGNSAATPYSVNYDATAPTLVISGPTGPINVGFTASFTFSENVTGFTVADIIATNGVISNFSAIDGKLYSATVTPTSDGLVTLSVGANSAVDIANNPNVAASQYSLSYDVTKPTLVVSGPTGPVNGAISLTFTFSEAVVNFSLADITVVNGAMSQLLANTGGSVYTATLTPTTDGTTTVNVNAGVANDLASNTNLGAAQYSVLYDSTKSGVVISAPVGPVNSAFTATFTFSEAMTGFTIADISLTNATVSNFVATSSAIYTATITPTTDGTVVINVAADVALDSANNGNAQASPYRLEYDITRPTVVISAPVGPVNAGFTATFTFSETVSGFSQSDLQVSNASVSQFVAVSGSIYTATITPTTNGQVTINLPANSAIDTASNNNVAASQYQLLYDFTRPSVAISAVSGPVNASFVATVTFSESVSQFSQGGITVSNASLSDFKTLSASIYSVVVRPIADGQVTVNIAANVATDAATNGNTAASQLALIYDITKPTLVINGPTATINAPFTATFTFSEAVSGFTIDDIQVNLVGLSKFTRVSASEYTVLVSPNAFGTVVVDVAANAAIDAATNGNVKGSALTVNFDSTPPVLTFEGPAGPVNSSIKLAIKASEAVTDFTIDDITAENATLTGFSQIDPLGYEVTVDPIADGTVKVNIGSQAVKDVAGNFNNITADYTVIFDSTAPGVVISGGSAAINQPFVATFTFNADVSGFTVDDIVIGNGSLSEFTTVSSAVYQVKVTPISDGEVTLDVGADSASDTAGNGNVPASRYRVIYDKTPPTFTIDGPSGSVNAAFTAILNFSEVVSGLDVSDVKVTNGTLSSFATTDNQRYTMKVTPLVNGIVSLDVAIGAAQDTAGNSNSIAVTYSITYDVVLPSLTISGPDGTVNGPFTVNFDFSKEVSGFSQTDITVTNGTLSGFNQITGARYSVLVAPQNAGNVSINVAANVAQDSAGNGNSAATGLVVNYDNGGPTVSLSAPSVVNDRFAVNIRFSEPVSGFEATDVNVSNANLLSFQALSTSEYRIDLEPLNSGLIIIAIAANVAQDAVGNGNERATDLQVEFDNIPPTVTATDPVDDALDASGTTHLLITFDEIINAAPGNDKLIELFQVGNEVAIASFVASSDKVKIDIHQVSLVDPLQLKANQQYYLHITSGAFVDVVGNPYAGINDQTSWNFTVDNIAPVAVADSVAVDEDTPVVIDVLANDFDNDGSVDKTTVTLVQTSDVAILTVDPQSGVISYTPSSNFNGQDSFSYTVNDDLGKISNTATVTVTVDPINDAPTAVDDVVTTVEDLPVAIDVLANDSDIDVGDTLNSDSLAIVAAPSHGSVTINAGTFIYNPVSNYFGADSFSYTVADPQGAVSNVATVTISVISNNDAPVALNDNSQTNEDTAVLINVLSNDQDPENNLDVNSIIIVTQPAHGLATVVNGQVNYVPASNYFGQDTFTYQVSDGDGQASNHATVSVTIIAQTDAPIAANDNAVTNEDVAIDIDVTANDSSVDTTINVNSVVIANQPSNGSVTVGQSGNLNYRPNQNFFGQDSLRYTVRDSNGIISAPATVSIVVNSVNDAPVITSQAPTQANPASEYRYQLVASDVDGDNLTITASGPSWLVFDGVDTLSGTPPVANIGQVVSVEMFVTDNVIVTPISQRFEITVNEPTATTLALTSVASENPTKVANNIDIRYTITNNGQVSGLLDTLTIELTGTSGLNSVPTNCLVSVNANNRDVVSCTLASSLAPGASEILTINLPVVVNGDGEIVSRAQLSQQRVSTFVSKTLVVLVTQEIVDQPGQVLPPSSTADSAFGDVNNDGLADLVIVNTNGQANQIHHNIGAGQFEPQQTFDEGSDSRGVALADLDNDGALDIVVANHGTSPSGFYLNDGAGNFSTITSFGQLLATGVSVADFNGDGLLDIVFGTDQQVGNRIFIQPFDFGVPRNVLDDTVNLTRDGNFNDSELSHDDKGRQARVAANAIAVATGDLNGDQHIDIVIGYENNGLEILYNAGGGSFTSVNVQSLIDAAVIVVADINDDGMAEVFVSHRDGNTMILGATSPDNLVQINTTSAQDIAITDVNNDGQLDVMLINNPSGIRVFSYHADNTFTRSQTVIAVTGDGIAVADLDGDGDVDIIVTSRDENLGDEILFNEGAGNFGSQTVDLEVTLTTVSEVTEETSYEVELSYSNSGLGAGVAVQLHYVIDNGILQTVVAADPSQVSCDIISTAELTCNQASMAKGSSQGVVVTVVAGGAGIASHTLSISNASTDEDLTNNQLTDTVIVNAKPVPPEPPTPEPPTPEPPTPEPPTPEPPTPEPPKRRSGGSLSWLLLLCSLMVIRRRITVG